MTPLHINHGEIATITVIVLPTTHIKFCLLMSHNVTYIDVFSFMCTVDLLYVVGRPFLYAA